MPDSTYTLGINAAFHDSAACLVRDGVVLAAAEEERFTHVKHAKRPVPFSTWELPYHAIDYCLAEADITLAEVAAHGMERTARMTVPNPDDLRLVLDALVALHTRRRRPWIG